MKFCPKCGTQLVDEARFCSKCGAAQPNMENAPAPQPVAPQPTPQQNAAPSNNGQMTPGQRYNYLKQNDERFRGLTKVIFFLKFVGLVNILFIIPWILSFAIPIATFTGVNVSDVGANLWMASKKPIPWSFNNFDLAYTIIPWTKGSNIKLSPDSALQGTIMPQILMVFGYLFTVLIVLTSLLGNPRGYVLKTYDKDEGQTLYKNIKGNTTWLIGPSYAVVSLASVIATYINCTDLKYEAGKTYLLGEIAPLQSGLITCIVVTVIFVAIMVAVPLVIRSLLLKKFVKMD